LVVVIANFWSLKVEMSGITKTEKVLANLKPEDFERAEGQQDREGKAGEESEAI
jgi:hypothetical protein